MTRRIVIACACALLACGGDVFEPGDGGDGGDASDAAGDAASDGGPCSKCVDAGTFSCGDTTCSGTNAVCIHPCCGGAILCEPYDDGGTCPDGLTPSNECPPEMPCSNACTPPPPFCGTVEQCPEVSGHDCYELCG